MAALSAATPMTAPAIVLRTGSAVRPAPGCRASRTPIIWGADPMPLASEMIGRPRAGTDRNGAWRKVAGRRPPGRRGGAGHRDQHRGEPADREDPAVGVQAWVRLRHPGQPHWQQRRQGEGKRRRQAGRGGPDRGGPANADRHQLAAARPKRPQGGVVARFGKAQPGQHLPQDQHADGAENPGDQPQRDRLQMDRTLGIRRLRGERGAARILAVSETDERALHRRHVSRAVAEPQRCHGEALGLPAVRAPEGGGRPHVTGPGTDLGRELGSRSLDPGHPEHERDRRAVRRCQQDPKGVSWFQMPRLRQHERDVDRIGPAGIREPAGDDLPSPQAAGDPVVFRCEQVDPGR